MDQLLSMQDVVLLTVGEELLVELVLLWFHRLRRSLSQVQIVLDLTQGVDKGIALSLFLLGDLTSSPLSLLLSLLLVESDKG